MDGRWVFFYVRAVACACRCRHCFYHGVGAGVGAGTGAGTGTGTGTGGAASAAGQILRTDLLPGDAGPPPHNVVAREGAPGSVKSAGPLEFPRLREMIEPFVAARDAGTEEYSQLALTLADAPLNYPDLPDLAHYQMERGIEGALSIPVNGFRQRSEDEWGSYPSRLREAGAEALEITLYGDGETHDRFARRPGDFEMNHALAARWRALGGQVQWGLVAHRESMAELGALRTRLAAHDEPIRPATIWGYFGTGTSAEELRPTAADLAAADPETRAELEGLRPERDWVEAFAGSTDEMLPAKPPVLHVALEGDGTGRVAYHPASAGLPGLVVGSLPAITPGEFVSLWQRRYDEWRGSFPAVGELASRHGERASDRLHTAASVKQKWCHAYAQAHDPED